VTCSSEGLNHWHCNNSKTCARTSGHVLKKACAGPVTVVNFNLADFIDLYCLRFY
jgi:hypothetical protein